MHPSEPFYEQFSRAAKGERVLFGLREPGSFNLASRRLMRTAEKELFIFTHDLDPDQISDISLMAVANGYRGDDTIKRTPPRIRIVVEPAATQAEQFRREFYLNSIAEFLVPNGPIEVRQIDLASPVHAIVSDAKHICLENNDPCGYPWHFNLNMPDQAERSMKNLEDLWAMSTPVMRMH